MVTEINKYQILKELGSGQFGTVYLVLDRALNVQKAIKVIFSPDASILKKNLDEAKLLYMCRHKNIVHVNEANVFEVNTNPSVIIDMELINGGSIENILNSRFVSILECVKIICGVLYGLEHAHTYSVIHRDIKPANILYDGVNPKLSDFGLATNSGAIHTASAQGYVQHLAPEVFTLGLTSFLTDIYAVGVTLYRVCNNITNWQLLMQQIPDPVGAIQTGNLLQTLGYQPFVPKKLIKIIKKATEKDPINRYQSVLLLRQALEKLKPGIDWIPIDNFQWQGIEVLTGNRMQISAINNDFIFKKNNRTVANECKSFSSNREAVDFLYEYIQETTFAS